MIIDELIEDYYNKFVGLPTGNPIVRQNQKNDAFEIVVLETLYGEEKNIKISSMKQSDVLTLSKYIVAPPDAGIDIVVEVEDIDDSHFEFVQVKNQELSQLEIRQALDYMKNTVAKYMKKPASVNENVRKVLAETTLCSADKQACKYIVVHRGLANYCKDQIDGIEQVISGTELELIKEDFDASTPKVKKEKFLSDSFNNFISYEQSKDNPAILINLCGYNLAELAIKYTNTALGRNILFGQNLREEVDKSKTYEGMKGTIEKEPEKFWFYNNGITILAEDYNVIKDAEEKVDSIVLERFSIINGAQTTSALGRYYKEAQMDGRTNDIDKLKKVFVLVRVLKVNDDDFSSNIAQFNNTQNPISTRDMVSSRTEQNQLHKSLLNGNKPNIYMEIKRGTNPPADVHFYKHQIISNDELAQLAFAGFYRDPFTAKDKKNSIFEINYKQEEYLLNKFYHRIFHNDVYNPEGILFKKNKDEINELLFVNYLFKESKKSLKKHYQKRISDYQSQYEDADDLTKKELSKKIANYERLKAICNVCVFYCIDYYYSYKSEFPTADLDKLYKYDSFYENRMPLIEAFRDFFLTETINIIRSLSENSANLNTWIRDKKSGDAFNQRVSDVLSTDMTLEDKYIEFIRKWKE